jgi:hypothetical protein
MHTGEDRSAVSDPNVIIHHNIPFANSLQLSSQQHCLKRVCGNVIQSVICTGQEFDTIGYGTIVTNAQLTLFAGKQNIDRTIRVFSDLYSFRGAKARGECKVVRIAFSPQSFEFVKCQCSFDQV